MVLTAPFYLIPGGKENGSRFFSEISINAAFVAEQKNYMYTTGNIIFSGNLTVLKTHGNIPTIS